MFERIKNEVLRMRAEIIILLVTIWLFQHFGISRANFETIVFKAGIFALANLIAHTSRQLMLPYICVEDAIFGANEYQPVPVPIRCAVISAVLILHTLFVYAILMAE